MSNLDKYAIVFYPLRKGRRYVALHPSVICPVITSAIKQGRYIGVHTIAALAEDKFWLDLPPGEFGESLGAHIREHRKTTYSMLSGF